jgi:hypothetical protein
MGEEKWKELLFETRRCYGSEYSCRDEDDAILWADARLTEMEGKVAEAKAEAEKMREENDEMFEAIQNVADSAIEVNAMLSELKRLMEEVFHSGE